MIFSRINPPKNFYVYAYLRKSDFTPYYIGKGKGKRAWTKHHFEIPHNIKNIVILADNLTEPDAFQAEMLLIKMYGRKDLGTGILNNTTDGGEGSSGGNTWRIGISDIELFGEERAKEISNKRVASARGKTSCYGKHNGMFGRSASKEQNLKWFTDGKSDIFVTFGTEPEGFVLGKSSINPKAKSYVATSPDGVRHKIPRGGLQEFCINNNVPYDGMKQLARTGKIGKRFGVKNWKCDYS